MNMFGYLMIWLAVTHRIARPRVWQVYLYMCVGANSQTFANTAVLVTCVKNFPNSRGVVLGLLKGFVGLSGAIFTQIYHALYGQDTRGVILLVGWLPSLVSLMFMFIIRPQTPQIDQNEGKYFYRFLYLALLLAGFLMMIIIVENQVSLSSGTYKAMGAITVLLVVVNMWIAVRAELEKVRQQQDESYAKPQKLSCSIPPSEDGKMKKHALFPSQENAPQDEESDTQAMAPPPLSPLSAPSERLISSGHTNGELHQLAQASGDAKIGAELEDKKPSQSQTKIKTSQENAPQSEKSETLAMASSPLSPLSARSERLISSGHTNGELHRVAKASGDATIGTDLEDEKPCQSQTQIEPTSTTAVSRPENAVNSQVLEGLNPLQRVRKCLSFKLLKAFYSNHPKRGDNFTIPQALVSLDMWILFVATTCGVGATLTAIDNMGQIGESQGYSPVSISTFVSLISIWNFLGRVVAGFTSEMLLKRYRFPRTLMLTIIIAMACVGHLLIAFPTPGSLYIASIIVGFCFGAHWPIYYAVISELFGLKYFATLQNVGAVASPVGSYLLNVRVAGYLYDKEARSQLAQLLSSSATSHAPPPATIASSDLTCLGESCFRETFLIMTGASVFASGVSLILALRTKKFYSQDIYARFKIPEDQKTSEILASSER